MSVTQRHISMIAALILFIVSVFRVPVAEGYFRALFQLIMETGILFCFALWVCTINKWVGMFLILTLFSSIYPNFGKWSYMARNTIFIGVLWYCMIVKLKLETNLIMNAICVIALINVVFANFQYCGLDPYAFFSFGAMKSTTSQPTGLMANKNLLSALLAISLPCFFRKSWKWFASIVFYGITIASSLGGAIAVFMGCLVYFFLKDGRMALIVNFIPIMALLVWFSFFLFYIDSPVQTEVENESGKIEMTKSANIRLNAWEKGMALYRNHPIFGYGIGHWKLAFRKLTPHKKPVMVRAHNEYLQMWFEMGILFPILCLGFFFNTLIKYRKEAILSFTSFVIIILNAFVNFPFHVATTAIIALTMMAIMENNLIPEASDG